jgi:hypothetical protein
MIEWNIQSRAHACQACSQSFVDKQSYHTVLLDARAGYTRQDLCEACWAKAKTEAAGQAGFISHWQGLFEQPAPQPELIRRETAETLLRKLIELDDPRHLAAVYILAVMLERKRLLKVKDQIRQDGRRVFVYEQPRTGDVFTVADPDLSLDQLDEVQRDVAHLLEHGLPAVDPSPLPAPAAGETPAPTLAPPSNPAPDSSATVAEAPPQT